MTEKPPYVLHATAVVGCGISIFFCVVSLVGFSCFRPRTESMLIKKHLTFSVCATQTLFLVAIEGYKVKIGCHILSVLLHLTATGCFTWCAIDALGLYLFHANSFHVIRNTNLYLLLGWGIPCVVLILSMVVGHLEKSNITYNLSLYNCWSSDTIVWAFVVPAFLVAVVDIVILCTIVKQLRYPSYDISPKAVIEKRGTRYGLRTNSLMLLGICVGWIFAILSLRGANNIRYQLAFGLVNGLQGIFLFFFHCLLNTDHVKGYISTSSRTSNNEEDGRSDTKKLKNQETQTSTRKGAQRTSKLENVPLISLNSGTSKQEEESVASCSHTVTFESCFASVDIVSEPLDNKKQRLKSPDVDVIPQLPGRPNHDIIQQLPGTPAQKMEEVCDVETVEKRRKSSSEPVISSSYVDNKEQESAERKGVAKHSARSHDSKPKKPRRPHSSVNENSSCRNKPVEELNFLLHQKADNDRSRAKRRKTADIKLQVYDVETVEKRRKSSSEPVISSSYVDNKEQECAERKGVAKHSARSHESKPKRPRRPHSSVNELESLFSRPDVFTTKPHRSSMSSLQGPRPSKERKNSHEEKQYRKSMASTDTHDEHQ